VSCRQGPPERQLAQWAGLFVVAMEAALKQVLQKQFGEYVQGLDSVDCSKFPVQLNNMMLNQKAIQEELSDSPFDFTDGRVGNISIAPGWMGSLEVQISGIVLNLAFNPMKAMQNAMKPEDKDEEQWDDRQHYGGHHQQERGPPAAPPPPVAPRFCCDHDSSEKRVKCEPYFGKCKKCDMELQTSYSDFVLCPPCSEHERSCMICGNQAGRKGDYIPSASLDKTMGAGDRGGGKGGRGGDDYGPMESPRQRRDASRGLPAPPPGHGGHGDGDNFRKRNGDDYGRSGGGGAPPPPPPPPNNRDRGLNDSEYGKGRSDSHYGQPYDEFGKGGQFDKGMGKGKDYDMGTGMDKGMGKGMEHGMDKGKGKGMDNGKGNDFYGGDMSNGMDMGKGNHMGKGKGMDMGKGKDMMGKGMNKGKGGNNESDRWQWPQPYGQDFWADKENQKGGQKGQYGGPSAMQGFGVHSIVSAITNMMDIKGMTQACGQDVRPPRGNSNVGMDDFQFQQQQHRH